MRLCRFPVRKGRLSEKPVRDISEAAPRLAGEPAKPELLLPAVVYIAYDKLCTPIRSYNAGWRCGDVAGDAPVQLKCRADGFHR